MRPSAVKQRIVAEHQAMRGELEGLERLAERLERGDQTAVPEAAAAGRAMFRNLVDHIDLEDAILAPALREADAWGDVRADTLLKHHAEQRAALDDLATNTPDDMDPAPLAFVIRSFIDEVRKDMHHEEQALLDRDVLREDLIGIDVSDG